MALFLDSALKAEVQRAHDLGFIEGVTTNPKLMAQTGQAPLEVLEELSDIFDGHIFYQVSADSPEGRIDEAWQAYETRPDRVVVKIPMTTENLRLIYVLSGVEIAMTGVYSVAQAYLAAEAGAHYIIPYVNRITRALGDGPALVAEMVQIVAGSDSEILAASLKSIPEAIQTLRAGANHISLPLALIEAMGDDPLTFQAIDEFKNA